MRSWRGPIVALALALGPVPGRGDDSHGKLPATASAILDGAESIELLSIDPKDRPSGAGDDFHGWKVLGRAALRDPDRRRAVVEALRRGVEEADDAEGCFEPRHGLRATKGGLSADLVICFSCRWIEVRAGGETAFVRMSGSPRAMFNAILRAAAVELAQDSEGP
jgi:hypothetical protein